MNGHDAFTQDKGGIETICKEWKIYDPFKHHHSDQSNANHTSMGKAKYISVSAN